MKSMLNKLIISFKSPGKLLEFLARSYIKYYRDFNYEFSKNGEELILKKIKTVLKPKIFFDAGANIGEWAAEVKKIYPESEIHCFEIANDSFLELQSNLRDADIKLNLSCLTNLDGEVEFKDYGQKSAGNTIIMNSSFREDFIQPKICKINAVKGDTYCELNKVSHIDFLKLDVEGSEYLVLEGFNEMLSKNRITLIQFEYGYINGDSKFLMKDYFKLFEKYGYVITRLSRKGMKFKQFDYSMNNFESGPNYIAVHKTSMQLINLIEGI